VVYPVLGLAFVAGDVRSAAPVVAAVNAARDALPEGSVILHAAPPEVLDDRLRREPLVGWDRVARLREDRGEHGLVGARERGDELPLEHAPAARVRARLEDRAQPPPGVP